MSQNTAISNALINVRTFRSQRGTFISRQDPRTPTMLYDLSGTYPSNQDVSVLSWEMENDADALIW